MNTSPAYLITDPDDSTKTNLRLIGATWSLPMKGYFITQEQKDRLDRGDIPKPSGDSGIVIEDEITEWKVSGNTYPKKDVIRQLGGKWKPAIKSWVIPMEKATKEDIEAALL